MGFSNNLALLVFEVREVSGSFLLSEFCSPLLPLFVPASDDLRDTLQKHASEIWQQERWKVDSRYLVNLVTAVFLEVTLNVAQERDIK